MEDPGSSLTPWEDAELCMLTWFATVSWERKKQRVLQSALCWSPSVKDTCGQANTASTVMWFSITSVCLMCFARTPQQCHTAGLSQQPWKAAWRAWEVIGYLANHPQRSISEQFSQVTHGCLAPVFSALWATHQALVIWGVGVGIFLEPHTGIVLTILFPVQLHRRFLAFEGVNFSNDETSLALKS